MDYGMKRADYEELKVLGPIARGDTVEDRAACLAQMYPKNTAGVVLELRSRGYNANVPMLEYLIKKGAIPAPADDGGRNRQWSPADIDRAAAYLEREQIYVPGTVARMFYNIDPAQDERAQQEVFAKHPDLVGHQLVMEILPGADGVDLYSQVRYRRMTPKEEAEWRARIARAKRLQGKGKK